jgi:hypothetical protein
MKNTRTPVGFGPLSNLWYMPFAALAKLTRRSDIMKTNTLVWSDLKSMSTSSTYYRTEHTALFTGKFPSSGNQSTCELYVPHHVKRHTTLGIDKTLGIVKKEDIMDQLDMTYNGFNRPTPTLILIPRI